MKELINKVTTGDARELTTRIPDESIDLIFTDPVYDRIEDYEWLGHEAKRILKPDSACLVFCGIEWLGQSINAIQKSLSYQWQLILAMPYRNGGHIKGGFSQYISCLWFMKGDAFPKRRIPDMRLWRAAAGPFKWAKNPDFIMYYMAAFTESNSLVLDPFVGLGTMALSAKILGLNYIAFEIEPEIAELARERVLNTQPPLFVLEPEQLEFDN